MGRVMGEQRRWDLLTDEQRERILKRAAERRKDRDDNPAILERYAQLIVGLVLSRRARLLAAVDQAVREQWPDANDCDATGAK